MNRHWSGFSQLFTRLAAVLMVCWSLAGPLFADERRMEYRCPGGETFSAIFAADGQSVILIVGETSRKLELEAGGKYFTADAVFFGDDPETGAYVAEGEVVILQDCRPERSGQ